MFDIRSYVKENFSSLLINIISLNDAICMGTLESHFLEDDMNILFSIKAGDLILVEKQYWDETGDLELKPKILSSSTFSITQINEIKDFILEG
jgi:hypothetical protein